MTGAEPNIFTIAGGKLDDLRDIKARQYGSFDEFLRTDAKVPAAGGLHQPFTFKGREALQEIVKVVDKIIGKNLCDAEVSLAGGAQFGKTILELNLAAYVTGQKFRNFGLYLPDDDLVEGIVDSKFRPDVVDQIDWFARMVQVGKALNKSGKAVNRKGAFLVTDGVHRAVGMIRGLGKVPTTFSMDVGAMDEVDDIDPRMMKFVRGRLTASDLRFIFKIGTQRVHGRGMNKAWKDGSQGVFIFKCPGCGRPHNPEEEFPPIVRLVVGKEVTSRSQYSSRRARQSPKLTWAGDFKFDGNELSTFSHDPLNSYYLGCVNCGTELDRFQPTVTHRMPALVDQRKWSFRISQLAIGAIDLAQIVGRFQAAVADPEEMIVFRCDVLGLPQSTSQALTPALLERARTVFPHDFGGRPHGVQPAFGGLDMGDRCWLLARTFENAHGASSSTLEAPASSTANPSLQISTNTVPAAGAPSGHYRLLAVERISAGDVVARVESLFHSLKLSALFIDERPLVNEARTLALALNGLQTLANWPRIANLNSDYVSLPGGLTWDGKNARWLNLKCAVVRFTRSKLGAGIEQSVVFFEEGGQTKFVPCIACNRFETIDRVVREFLTPAEGVVEIMPDQKIRETPALLLPRLAPGHPPTLDLLDAHLITGSEREKAADGSLGDYVDGCENHLLLANGYAKLAEIVAGKASLSTPGPILALENTRRSQLLRQRQDRSVLG